MNLIDVVQELGTEEAGFAFFEQMRWPEGKVRCTTCGNDKISRVTRKSSTKNVRKNIYQCLEPTCKQQFSVTSGTIFHDTRIPLAKWFMAISIIMDAKKGISAKQLQEHLGLGSYQTAWHMTHRIRKAMQDTSGTKLKGIVELDETYIGGKAKRRGGSVRNQKPRAEKFDMVMGMRERNGRVRFVHIADGKKESIRKAIDEHIDPSVKRIYTDAAAVYDVAMHSGLKKRHRKVNHSKEWIVPGSRIHTNTVESSFSLLKRGLIGSFHRVSIKHLHRYLSEFELRFNERKATDRFSDMVMRIAQTSPLTYQKLIAEPVA
ncbi:MAG TPA: IS1595 family transposase [Edaphobacter sp.]|jgi:transposase-like protein|nr:IS1595 family transposase [Edaphobacter sp.]